MKNDKIKKLKSRGWSVGNTQDFLGLSNAEMELIDLKIKGSAMLREQRKRYGLTQTDLAKLIGSSQPRIAGMESGEPNFSFDLLIKALLAMNPDQPFELRFKKYSSSKIEVQFQEV